MKYGLSEKQLNEIIEIIASYQEIEKAIIFGSRAMDTYKVASDVDIAICGEMVDIHTVGKLKDHLEEESYLPFFFDIINYNSIKNENLIQHIQNKGKVIFQKNKDEWKEVKLGDLVNLISEKTSIEFATLDNYISTDNMIGNFGGVVNAEKLPTTNKVNIFQKGDTLFSNIRTYFKKVWYSSFNGTVSADVLVFRPKDNKIVNSKFLYYLLCNNEFTEYSVLTSKGAKMPRGDKDAIKNYTLNLPPLTEQKAIAEVLSSLDDKVDLLNRQNKTLEQMAETLFRQWFIEEADEDWEVLKLSDIAEVKNGFSFRSKDYIEQQDDSLEVLKMGHISKDCGLKSNPKKDFVDRIPKLEKYILNKNDIVIAMTDMKDNVVILGVPAMIDKSNHYVLNQRVARVYLKSKQHLLSPYFLYLQLRNRDNIALLQSKANSGVQVNLTTQAIKDIEILIPPIDLQKNRNQNIEDLYKRIEKNQKQIKTLEKMRDTLLPKLMSGEVRV